MAAIRRNPAPPGPVTELLDRLHELHLAAGQPSVRRMAVRIGRGRISSSTIHNMFRGPRVPGWEYLELVVQELRGDTVEFLALWQAARLAEDAVAEPVPPSVLDGAVPPPRPAGEAAGQGRRVWSTEIPRRNPNFTGRAAELDRLAANLAARRPSGGPAIQVISGMGGLGKTEIATEYVHRHGDEYSIIWWIRSENHDRVRDALVELGRRLELRQAADGGERDRAIAAVLAALGTGARPSWLLVYDNATQPLDLQPYLPACVPGGHVIVTSRLRNWPGYIEADGVHLAPFTEDEAVTFLRRRVPGLALHHGLPREEDARRTDEARRLAAALGHLPIAAEHAGAYLAETRQSVGEYLDRFAENAHRLLSEQPADFPAPVSATWAVSTTLLSADAVHLFNACAFFSPEPIAAELFLDNGDAVTEPPELAAVLTSAQRFRAACGQLHRLSLAKVDGAHDLIQLHRVVQAVTRGRLRQDRPAMFHAYRRAVDALLAASDPGNPDRRGNDGVYDLSLQHLESEPGFLNSADPGLQRLIVDQVRRLHLRGGHVEAVRFGQRALAAWRGRFGADELPVLTLAVEVAIAMRMDGHDADARQLTLETLPLLRRSHGDEHEVTLLCANTYGADLRGRGQLGEALELDLSLLPKFERVFGVEHERTLNVRNNIAADYRRLGRYREALEYDRRTHRDRRRVLGTDDIRTLHSHDAVARDLRGLGAYQESLDTARRVVHAFEAVGGGENLDRLNARKGFAVALRKAGHHWDALRESEDVVQRYLDYLGPDRQYTLRAAANLISDRRAVSDLARAEELGREVLERCRAGFPYDLTYAVLTNLASVLRVTGRAEQARRYDLQAREGFIGVYGDRHPFTLAVTINYASDLAELGELAEAIRVGEEVLVKCRETLGEDHPDTLIAATNLALDRASAGDREAAGELLVDTVRRYERTLTLEHPEARAAIQRVRLTAEIEPY